MMRFKFKQVNGWPFLLDILLLQVLFRILNDYVETWEAIVITLVVGIITTVLLYKKTLTIIEYFDEHIVLRKSFSSKPIIIQYRDITRITFAYDQGYAFWIYTDHEKYKVPSPLKLPPIEELFTWLQTKNSDMTCAVFRPAYLENKTAA